MPVFITYARNAGLLMLGLHLLSTSLAQDSTGLKNPMGEVFNQQSFNMLRSRKTSRISRLLALPIAYSLKKYAPNIRSQVGGTCFAYSSAYAARTILYNLTVGDSADPNENAFSPGFIIRIVQKKRLTNLKCSKGADVSDACLTMENIGAIKDNLFPDECTTRPYQPFVAQANLNRVKVSAPLFQICADTSAKVSAIKNSIASRRPVILAINSVASFHGCYKKELWEPTLEERAAFNCNSSNHAICVIGYDNDVYGGCFEIMNSWGTDWGNHGFVWIKYSDLAAISMYGLDIKNVDPGEGPQN